MLEYGHQPKDEPNDRIHHNYIGASAAPPDWVQLKGTGFDGKPINDPSVHNDAEAKAKYGANAIDISGQTVGTSRDGVSVHFYAHGWDYVNQIIDPYKGWNEAFQAGIRANSRGLEMAKGVSIGATMVMSGGLAGGEVAGNFLIDNAGTRSFQNVVYQGIDSQGIVRYVGITEREAGERFAEHLASLGTGKELLRYEVIEGATNLPRIGARVWEQSLINEYGLMKNGGQLLNKINSIAPKYWWRFGIQ
jgi:hypothetical protein